MSADHRSLLHGENAAYLQLLFDSYRKGTDQLAPAWQNLFRAMEQPASTPVVADSPAAVCHDGASPAFEKQAKVLQLVNAHRFRGHRCATLNPLQQQARPALPELGTEYYGFTGQDMQTSFSSGSLYGMDQAPLSEILKAVQDIYCGTVGAEYMHINDTRQKRWLQERLEPWQGRYPLEAKQQRRILDRLIAAESLERHLHTRYVGQKRFSLEGGESLIPLLDDLLAQSGDSGTEEVVLGMAHRGRLNVLINIIGKLPSELFDEFEDSRAPSSRSGDVKYHRGYSSDLETSPGTAMHVTLAFNPSHLEIISPVVVGSVRARQERCDDRNRNRVLPILIHGDAAFAGQGVVMETMNLSQTRGYATGGTIHLIINNQIGFTTSDPLDARSTLYCTDVAKMIQAPIFHVNCDDPEALVFIGRLALAFRNAFNRDVVIDMVCYRRHGHSEADEPFATQPLMYQQIQKHAGTCNLYAERLLQAGTIQAGEPQQWQERYIATLEHGQPVSMTPCADRYPEYRINFTPYIGTRWDMPTETSIPMDTVQRLTERLTTLPEHFQMHPSVARIIQNRRRMGSGEIPADWGFAESLAYASLLEQGYPVRLSGQDSGRGTFFHRHAVLHDQITGNTWLPLQHLARDQARFLVINSILSEEAVLAFEYGYSSSEPSALVIWEAQFGDFANGAQVIFDQFLSSCEAKWDRQCGLTVMLPHGYDGMGPEHSSARLERYLQLCAEENLQVCVPSTAVQMFHLLRRQAIRPYRKPLIIMSPKSLLRQRLSASPLEEFSNSGFQTVFDDPDPTLDPHRVKRLLICCGKVYYDLLQERSSAELHDIAILRMEQLYPFPLQTLRRILERYRGCREAVWTQEEPQNQGSWGYMQSVLPACLAAGQRLLYAGRHAAAAPATGSMAMHIAQQKRLISDALQLTRQSS